MANEVQSIILRPTFNMATLNARVDEEDAYVYVYDRRSSGAPEVKISTGGLFTFSDFKDRVCAVSEL